MYAYICIHERMLFAVDGAGRWGKGFAFGLLLGSSLAEKIELTEKCLLSQCVLPCKMNMHITHHYNLHKTYWHRQQDMLLEQGACHSTRG